MTIQDFGVSYEELEPFFDNAEKVFGTSGTAWTIKGQKVGEGKGGNPYARVIARTTSRWSRRKTPSLPSCSRRQRWK
jgi:choline dehydrogenase-like flavoprotein